MNKNINRVINISKELGLTHIGSNISVLPILEKIYAKKKPNDKVVLDNAHAHLAHLITRSDRPDEEVKFYLERFGIHCERRAGCDASGGSLGHGLGIGIGLALANKNIKVYVIVSDGSMMEGSNWEALRIITDLNIKNIEIYCNFNGFSAVAEVDNDLQAKRMMAFMENIKFYNTDNTIEFAGLEGHYKKL